MNWASPQVALLADGRLHLQHGPIDLLIGTLGASWKVRAAHEAAIRRFETILVELTAELKLLRTALAGHQQPEARSTVARRMIEACWPHRAVFITPMAAVAGSVADEIAETMLSASPDLRSLYINNGGDIALHVADGEVLRIGLVADLQAALPDGVVTVTRGSGVGGIATSGWRGRSFSLGIADAVTVLARNAAVADAAATMIANAVNLEHDAVRRAPAHSLDPDSDLGDLLVTTQAGPLPADRVADALKAGASTARRLLERGGIVSAALALQGRWLVVGGEAIFSGTGLNLPPVA